MRRPWLPLLLVLAPAAAGIAGWLVIRLGVAGDFVIYSRFRLSLLLPALGLLLTLIAGLAFAQHLRLTRRARQAQREIREAEAARHRQFLRRLDHELKNPLTALQVEVANLDPGQVSGAAAESGEAHRRLKTQVMRLNELVIHLRKLGELEDHRLEREPISLAEMLRDLVQEAESAPQVDRREISLNLPQAPWQLPPVQGDADLIYMALHNLLSNAVKFTRPAEAIQIRAFESADQVIVEVADQGPGIPEEELEHIWEELYRGKMARGLPGSGLGLPLVKAIVERHGGQVSARSRPNQGTVISVQLPVGT